MISHESAVENGRQSAIITNDILLFALNEDAGDGDSDEENTFSSSISSMDHLQKEFERNNAPEQIVSKPTKSSQNTYIPNEPLTESTTATTQQSHFNTPSPLKPDIIEDKDGPEKDTEKEVLTDDDVAKRLSNLMSRGESLSAALNVGLSVVERTTLIESIILYSRHVPNCVVADLVAEVMNEQDSSKFGRQKSWTSNIPEVEPKGFLRSSSSSRNRGSLSSRRRSITRKPMTIPHTTSYECALLFVDISGFTAISRLLDVESLSKAINTYFQKIVDEIISCGGDILKFAGDAIFAEWRVGSSVSQPKGITKAYNRSDKKTMTIEECVTCAASCGTQIVSKCSDHPVYSNTVAGGMGSRQLATLNVHCGLGSGILTGAHVGSNQCRREYIIMGEPIDQVAIAESKASLGELMASPEALLILKRGCYVKKELTATSSTVLLASRRTAYFVPKRKMKTKSSYGTYNIKQPSYPKISFETMESSTLKNLHKLLSLYIHQVVTSNDALIEGNTKRLIRDGQATLQRHRADAELRNVCTLFIMPLIRANVSNDPKKNESTIMLLNNILTLVSTILDKFKGHLRQFIVDDKGVVLIATFGLRGSTFPNLVSERTIPASRIIHAALISELGVASQIGATRGKAYCGVVGGIRRHEYAVLGPSVNLAARLMSLPNHPGILVDNALRVKATCNFMALAPVKAKGYISLVPIFKPLSAREAMWGKINPNFVGRRNEMKELCKLAQEMSSQTECPVKLQMIMGDSGLGKSAFIVQTVAVMRKLLSSAGKRIIVARNVSNRGDSMAPFSLLRSIFHEVLRELKSSARSEHRSNPSQRSRDWGNMSLSSMSSKNTNGTIAGAFIELCEELNASEEIIHVVGHLLLGDKSKMLLKNEKAPAIAEVVSFLAEAFITCTSHADLVILALDDVQWMDSASWNVIQSMFETGRNILILCGTRSLRSYHLSIHSDFWHDLGGQYKYEKRYFEMNMSPLTEADVLDLVAKSLSCRNSDIDEKVSKYIFLHSEGIPIFTSEIIRCCKKENLLGRGKNNKIQWITKKSDLSNIQFPTLDELITSRIDHLNDSVRKTLQIASVLGAEFDERDIRGVYGKLFGIQDENMTINDALSEAVDEGILEDTIYEEDEEDIGATSDRLLSMTVATDGSATAGSCTHVERKVYRFHHDTWLRVISSLLLKSFKRDIHLHAALALESGQIHSDDMIDYHSKLKLLRHWKGCGNVGKVSEIALEVGKMYKDHALFSSCTMVCEEAISLWKEQETEDEDRVAGMSSIYIDSFDADSLKQIVMIYIAKGQSLGSDLKKEESMMAFAGAFEIYKRAPVREELQDRAFVFPIFSGLFFLLKYAGSAIGEDEGEYEKNLVSNFVNETKEHGDPIHYSRALAMEVEMNYRLGKWEGALESQEKIEDIYVVEEHSAKISEVYASDRVAQSFGISAICYIRLGQTQNVHKVCDFVLKDLMPKMDITNVHNSMICLYRVIWALKDYGRVAEARYAFRAYILQAFQDHYGEDSSTPTLAFFKPIEVLLEIFDEEVSEMWDEYINWVLDDENRKISPFVNNSMISIARDLDSIFAEICLILMKGINDERKELLIRTGLDLATNSMDMMQGDDGSIKHVFAFSQVKPIFDALKSSSEKEE